MSRKELNVARGLNELASVNLAGANATSVWTDLITDYFIEEQDEDYAASSSDSDSESGDAIEIKDSGVSAGLSNSIPGDGDRQSTSVHENYDDDDQNLPQNENGQGGSMLEVVVDQDVLELTSDIAGFIENDVEKEMEKIRNFSCECSRRGEKKQNCELRDSCSKKLNEEFIYNCRLQMSELTAYERDLILLGKISTLSRFTKMTQRPRKKVQTERKHQKTEYQIEGTIICRDTFRFVHNICQDTLTRLFKHYKENGLVPRKKKSGGRSNCRHLLKHDDIVRVVTFITNYAEDHAVILPGRYPGQKKYDVKLLPSNVTKSMVWRLYKTAMESLDCRAVKLSTFRKLWRALVPHIIRTKPMSDLCWVCQKNNYQVFRSSNLPEDVKSAKLKKQEQHLLLVKKERSYYQDMVKQAKEVCTQLEMKLQTSPPASRDIKMHYSFDYAQQVHFPSDPLQPGPMYFLTPRKCALFGVCCEAIPQQINYLIDESMASGKGSNSVINYLHHFFNNYGLGEIEARLHCDNCSGQNKNRFVLWYLAWRTMHGLHKNIGLHFLIAGHTKFAPDWCFGLIKQKYRRTRVCKLEDIASVVRESTVTGVNIPQLVGSENGTVYVKGYDWQTFLEQYFRPFHGIKSFQHFEFDSTTPGVVIARELSDSEESTRFQLLKDVQKLPPAHLPQEITPPGLSQYRQTYLYDHIREFCDDDSMNICCPKPHASDAQPNVKRQKTV